MLDTINLKPEGGEDDTWYHDDVDGEIDDRWQTLMVGVRMKHLPGQHDQQSHGVEMYHGTTEAAAKHILKSGLLVSKTKPDRTPGKKGVYATTTLAAAVEYGKLRASQAGKSEYGIVVLSGEPDEFSKEWGFGRFASDVPPSRIIRIEIRSSATGEVTRILKSEADAGNCYVGFVVHGDSIEYIDEPKVEDKALSVTQKEAGNYKMRHVKFQGFDISIENSKGSYREGKDKSGKAWHCKMYYDYGYIRRTEGVDGDHVDVYLGPDKNSKYVYIVHQVKIDNGEYDEDKCMIGFDSEDAAKKAYLKQYANPRFLGAISAVPLEMFREKVFDKKGKPVVPDAAKLVKKAKATVVLLGVMAEVKHLAGQHDQKKHAPNYRVGVATRSNELSNKVEERLSEYLADFNKNPAEVKKIILNKANEFIESSNMILVVTGETLEKIVSGGSVKNAFMTRTTMPAALDQYDIDSYLKNRQRVEDMWFGYDNDTPANKRPIYTLLSQATDLPATTAAYGDVQIVLNDNIKDRATVTFGDSINDANNIQPSSARSPKLESFGSRIDQVAESIMIAQENNWPIEKEIVHVGGYVEAQVFGGIKLKDIDTIIFGQAVGRDKFYMPGQELLAMLDRLGIRYRTVVEKHLAGQHDQQRHAGTDWATRSAEYDELRDAFGVMQREVATGRKVFRSDVDIDWKLLGLQRPTDEDLLDAYVPKTAELNCTVNVVVDPATRAIKVTVYNGMAINPNKIMSRSFDIISGQPTVLHGRFDLPKSLQNQGLGMDVLERSEAMYEKIGVRSIRLLADSEVGTYAWARAGFDFDPSTLSKLRTEIAFVEYMELKGLSRETRDEIKKNFPKTPWEFAAWKYDANTNGKEFMLKYSIAWDAVKYLDPASEGYRIGKAYYAWRRTKFTH